MSRYRSRADHYRSRQGLPTRPRRRRFGNVRLMIAGGMALFALVSYLSKGKVNPMTGNKQYIGMTEDQEIAMGLQALPQMIEQFGGDHPDPKAQELVDQIGNVLVQKSTVKETDWAFDFHLLADPDTVNAFALPGGQVFITYALFSKLETPGQLAGVLGHEIGHVVARHGAQRMAKQNLTQGLIGSVLMGTGSHQSAHIAKAIGNMVNMKYGRGDELESDSLGIKLMSDAGYNPHALKGVMKILAQSAGGGARQAEFFSTHPNPENRIEKINAGIDQAFPNGLPENLID